MKELRLRDISDIDDDNPYLPEFREADNQHYAKVQINDNDLHIKIPAGLARISRAIRLQRDLSVNLPGLALALELLDEIDHQRQQLASLKQQLEIDNQLGND
mgnify:CR=1 FL=1